MTLKEFPRLPLNGSIDLTYRCNNFCRHCWIAIPENAPEQKNEFSLPEIKRVIDEARELGCQKWSISGGEPMLHPGFKDIFDYITKKCVSYSLNTNGTLITPEIAHLMKRRGNKMVALYGATADTHDNITRNPGSFQKTMSGFRCLHETGAEFIVQIVPMRDNYHQLAEMIQLARSLSPHYRIGASWLYKSASGSEKRNREIERERLSAFETVRMDPDTSITCYNSVGSETSDFLFQDCVTRGNSFHIDPYGFMSFCSYMRDPDFRFDLREMSVREVWEKAIPAVATCVRGGNEYAEHCACCERRSDCYWCPAFGYLENGRYSAPVAYLCDIAREFQEFKEDLNHTHRRYMNIANITIQIDSELPISDKTFHERFRKFEGKSYGNDLISFHHFFTVPEIDEKKLGKLIYNKGPWTIYKRNRSWVYLNKDSEHDPPSFYMILAFNEDHTRGSFYSVTGDQFTKGNLDSLTLLPTDQIVLARILADRNACIFHASGMDLYGQGVLFVGHSKAGKSTTVTMLRGEGEILCDDRVIVRRWLDGFRIHGTWDHGSVPDVSNSSAPLKAIFFLEKANTNEIIPIKDRKEIVRLLPFYVVKPLVTADWWEKILDLIETITEEVPVYRIRLDKSGQVREIMKKFLCKEQD